MTAEQPSQTSSDRRDPSRWRQTRRPIAAIVFAICLATVALAGAGVTAVLQSVPTYTGCLTFSGGTVSALKQGNSPQKTCPAGTAPIRLSGGDITSVAVGSGLTGGGNEGDLTIGLNAQQSLPSCSNGEVPKWNGSAWSCSSDNDTTYTASTGLDLASNAFSVNPSYRLPQSCSTNQIIRWNGSVWACANETQQQLPHAYESTAQNVPILSDNELYTVVALSLPAGKYTVVSSAEFYNSDRAYVAACQLFVGSTALGGGAGQHLADEDATDFGEVAINRTVQFAGQTTVKLACNTDDDGVYATDASLIATEVGAIN